VRVVPAASVMLPALVRLREVALLTPVSTVALSSLMLTAVPGKVKEPKLVTSAPLSPRGMALDPAANKAGPLTGRGVPAAPVMLRAWGGLGGGALWAPVSRVALSWLMLGAVRVRVKARKWVTSAALPPGVMAWDPASNAAGPLPLRVAPAASVMLPAETRARL